MISNILLLTALGMFVLAVKDWYQYQGLFDESYRASAAIGTVIGCALLIGATLLA